MSAIISACGKYRYWLSRDGDRAKQPIAFVMLNPSTADGTQDDATIRRLYAFACNAPFVVVNLYAFRATSPKAMLAEADAVGPDNITHLLQALTGEYRVIAAWGNHARKQEVDAFADLAAAFGVTIHCIGTNGTGAPRHPLYTTSDTPITPWVRS